MEGLIGLAILIGLAVWCYKTGKQIGSRKGYGVGRSRGRRQRRR